MEGTRSELFAHIDMIHEEVDIVNLRIDTIQKESTNKIQLIKQHKTEVELEITKLKEGHVSDAI